MPAMITGNPFLLILIPAALSALALLHFPGSSRGHVKPYSVILFLTEGAALSCAAICVFIRLFVTKTDNSLWIVAAAFVLSIFGDLAMKRRSTGHNYIYGILFFFAAHLCFLVYAMLCNKGFSPVVLIVSIAAILVFFFTTLIKSPALSSNRLLAIAALSYSLISCFTLSAALNPGSASQYINVATASWIFAAGILCMITSDIFIALQDFAHNKRFSFLIMPLYLLSQVLITLSVTVKR